MEIYKLLANKKIYNWAIQEKVKIEGKEILASIGEVNKENENFLHYQGVIFLDLPQDFLDWFESEGKELKVLEDYCIVNNVLGFMIWDLYKELESMEYSNTTISDIIECFIDACGLPSLYNYFWQEKVKNELGSEINEYLDAKEMFIAEFGTFEQRDNYILKGKFEEYCSIVDSIAEYIDYESPIQEDEDYLEEEWWQLAENLEGCYEEGFSDIATSIIHLLRELATTKKYKAFTETIENLQKDNGNLLETAIKYTIAEDKKIEGLAICIERLGLEKVVEIIKEQ